MRKRQKFVLTAATLAVGVGGIQLASLELRYVLVGLLTGLTWAMSAWSLKEGLNGVEWLTVLLPPTLFTAGVGLFYILLPSHWAAKVAIFVLFAVGQYAQLLTANIYSVAAIRTIALFRSANAVGFVMTILTGFLLYNTVLSFRLGFWFIGPLVAIVSGLLALPALWSVNLEPTVSVEIRAYTFWLGILIGLLAIAVSFWPVGTTVYSLFLTTVLYVYLGLTQHQLSQRLFRRTVWEYVTVGLVVLTTMLITAGWGG